MSDAQNALAFERVGEPPGIEVIDRIEQQRYSVRTPEPIEPREVSAEDFDYPVTHVAEFETTEFTLPSVVGVFVHDAEGEIIARIDHEDSATFPQATYTLEISAQIKTYIKIEGPIEVESTRSETSVRFEDSTNIRLGVRSHHDHPAGTVTTTSDPADVMAAIETFGSALKTADPERSYPTLRGHPPAIEIGDELDIPDNLEPPENGITLELPQNLQSLFAAAPLAFYLGASLKAGPTPRLLTDEGFEYSLEGPHGFDKTVGRVLQQVFFFDCITRTEGLYQMPLRERERIEPLVDIDFGELYDRPVSEQVRTYLEVPFAVVEDHLPDWPLTTHVEATADTIEQLPFVVDDLALIRSNKSTTPTPASKPQTPEVEREEVLTRSAGPQESGFEGEFVQPTATETVEQAWIGEDIPIGASKLTSAAFQNRLGREVTEGDIEIAIVVNDDRMNVEGDIVDDTYGDREELPFDVTVYRNTTTGQLREILARKRGFLHYIGHTELDGFSCEDGKLDARTIEEVGIESFLLNACNSYRQGLALIEGGAIGGIVTLADIINREGVNMGESVARLLNAGFPLRGSLTIARDESIQGGQYIVVGDGGMSVTQPRGQTPTLLDVEMNGMKYDIAISTFTTGFADIGTILMPHLQQANSFHLASNRVEGYTITEEELEEILELEEMPIRCNGELYWSSSLDIADLQ